MTPVLFIAGAVLTLIWVFKLGMNFMQFVAKERGYGEYYLDKDGIEKFRFKNKS